MLTPTQIQMTEGCVLCWLATVNHEMQPNVSPKEMFVWKDPSTLLIAHIASPVSVRNLQANAGVCVSFLNIFIQKGLKLYGQARNITAADAEYSEFRQLLINRHTDAFPIQSIMVITITDVFPIAAPSYYLFPDTSEADRIADSLKSYRVEEWIQFHNHHKN